MSGRLGKAILFVLFCAAVIVLVDYALSRGARYRRRGAMPDSEEARAALAVIDAIAENPERVPEYLHPDTTWLARNAVVKAAELLNDAEDHRLKNAEWFGDYLRVAVVCTEGGSPKAERHFLFRQEDGQFLITGLQL